MKNEDKVREPEFFEDDFSLIREDDNTPSVENDDPEEVEEEEEEIPQEVPQEVLQPKMEVEVDVDENVFQVHYDMLKDTGILILPEDYKFEPTEEGLKSALEASKEMIWQEVAKEREANLDPTGKALLEYLSEGNGRDIEGFISLYSQPDFSKLTIEEDDDDLQENIMRVYLKNTTKYSEEKIEKEIAKYKLDNETYTRSTEALQELAEMQEMQKKEFLENSKRQEENRIKELDEARKMFSKTIQSSKDIKGIPFSPEDSVVLTDAIFKPIKDNEGNVTTKFNQKLMSALNDPSKTAILAKILEKDFDFTFMQRDVKTKVNSDLKSKLEKSIKTRTGTSVTSKSGFDWDSVSLIKEK